MKKWLLLILIFIIAGICLLYFVIPNKTLVQQRVSIPVNAKGFLRTFSDENRWAAWWPGEVMQKSGSGYASLRFNGNTYNVLKKTLSSISFFIRTKNDSFLTELLFIPLTTDSVGISWEGRRLSAGMSVNRLRFFYSAKTINKDMATILERLRDFYLKEENIYGMLIKQESVLDSTLISTSGTSQVYPTTESIYGLVNKLKSYAEKNGAKQTGFPMMNIYKADSLYNIKVALPVDKKLKDEGKIVYRWMLGGGNILVTEVRGGLYTINKAFAEMENYVRDFRRTAPAIPFQSLVTDRSKEPDTSKWVTKVYWPVM